MPKSKRRRTKGSSKCYFREFGEGVGPDSTGKMNSLGTGNNNPARTPQRFGAHPRGAHSAILGPCAGCVGVPARARGRAGGAFECAFWVQITRRYEIGASGWLPEGTHTPTATAQPLGRLAAPQRTDDPPVGSCVVEGAGEGREAPVRRPHSTLALWLLAVATGQPSGGGPRSRKICHIFPKLGRRPCHAVIGQCGIARSMQ